MRAAVLEHFPHRLRVVDDWPEPVAGPGRSSSRCAASASADRTWRCWPGAGSRRRCPGCPATRRTARSSRRARTSTLAASANGSSSSRTCPVSSAPPVRRGGRRRARAGRSSASTRPARLPNGWPSRPACVARSAELDGRGRGLRRAARGGAGRDPAVGEPPPACAAWSSAPDRRGCCSVLPSRPWASSPSCSSRTRDGSRPGRLAGGAAGVGAGRRFPARLRDVRPGGRVRRGGAADGGGGGIVAIGMSSEPLGLTSQTLVSRQLTVLGSLIYDHPGDFAMTMRADLDGLRPGRVLRACYPLDDAPSAFAAAREVPGKTWIRVGGDGTSGSLQKRWAAIQLTIRLVIRVRSAV